MMHHSGQTDKCMYQPHSNRIYCKCLLVYLPLLDWTFLRSLDSALFKILSSPKLISILIFNKYCILVKSAGILAFSDTEGIFPKELSW